MSPRRFVLPPRARAAGLAAAALVSLTPGLARADDTVPVGTPAQNGYYKVIPDASVQHAIDSVYPALVQIQVLTIEYQGGRERKFQAAGSGAIVSPEGYVVTNHHVAGKACAIKVLLSSKEEIPATLVGTDALGDIAVLKLDLAWRPAGSAPLPVAHWGNSSALHVGDVVLAMGCPLALSHSVTKGIVANMDLMMSRFSGSSFMLDGEDVGSLVKWIGHDAQIQPGNSGGPLVNLQGEIVGVNEIGVGTMSGAIPSDIARVVADDLIAHGKVRRAWTGAEFQPILKETMDAAHADGPNPPATARYHGALVSGVIPGSPAERGGLLPGDCVVAVEGEPIDCQFREELPAFMRLLLSRPIGKAVAFQVTRAGKKVDLSITPESRDDAQGKEVENKQWGLALEEITTMIEKELRRPDKSGVLVGSIRPGGPCALAQPELAAGDVIVAIGDKPVEGLDSFLAITTAITAGKDAPVPTVVSFERDAEHYLTLVEVGIKKPTEPTVEPKKAWLSVGTQVLSKKLATGLGLKGKKGVRIIQVFPESAAEQAGFQVGDIVTHIDGVVVDASEPQDGRVFETMIKQYKLGSTAEFSVIRGGNPIKISCVLNEAPKPDRELKVFDDVVLEFKARDVSYFDRVEHRWAKDQAGAIVVGVEPGGWAAVGGLHAQDVILAVDAQPTTGARELEAQLTAVREKRPHHVALLVKRGIHTLFIEMEPSWPEKR